MCIVVAKKKGVKMPTKETIKQCFYNNGDGAGLMYVDNGKVIIDKGYMSFGSFYKRIKKLKNKFGNELEDKSIVLHFRIGTAGRNNVENCHPYPISNNIKDLHSTFIETDLGIAHNGIIMDYTPGLEDKELDMNDTQCFIRDYIYGFKSLNLDFYKNEYVQKLILKESRDNKFALLDSNEDIFILGDFQENEGVYYSNGTYKVMERLSLYDDGDYNICQYGNADGIDLLGDYSVNNGFALKDYIDDDSLRLFETHTKDFYVGGETIFEMLDYDCYWAIDRNNRIYKINKYWEGCHKIYDLKKGELELYTEEYQKVDFYNFRKGDIVYY